MRRPRAGAATAPPNPPATIAGTERFIALAIRLVRIVPEAPTIMPGDDHRGVVQRDTGGRRRQARERVQQRDHDRHVGAADRQHDHVPEHRRGDAGSRR